MQDAAIGKIAIFANMKGRILFFIAVTAIALCLCSCTKHGHNRDSRGHGQNPQWPTARQWNKGVVGWNLGNQFECCPPGWHPASTSFGCPANSLRAETAGGNPEVTENIIKAVKEAGFNAIRIPVRWQCHILNDQQMQVDEDWITRVKEVVAWCLKYDLKVILNTHNDKWLESRPTNYYKDANLNRLALLWSNLATEFQGYDSRVAFAGTNEVYVPNALDAPTNEYLAVQNAYNQTFVDAVRSTGGNNAQRHLIVQTYACNPEFGLGGNFKVPDDSQLNGKKYLSVEFHFYDPIDYCREGTVDSWNGVARLTDLFDRAAAEWSEQGLGVVIGEWGVTDHGTDLTAVRENTTLYCKTYVSEAMKRSFSCFYWDNGIFGQGAEKFGIFNRSNNMEVGAPWVLNGITDAK